MNTKRFGSVLKLKSKSCKLPSNISMVKNNSSTSSQDSRTIAETPKDIAELFNKYFISVFSTDSKNNIEDKETTPSKHISPTLCDLSFTTSDVTNVTEGLDVNKATGLDNISIRKLSTRLHPRSVFYSTNQSSRVNFHQSGNMLT